MVEFNAEMARKLMNRHDTLTIWYLQIKDELFKEIRECAMDGKSEMIVHSYAWDSNSIKKEFLIKQLEQLGYKVADYNLYILISWGID
jgi:hypothetical protein